MTAKVVLAPPHTPAPRRGLFLAPIMNWNSHRKWNTDKLATCGLVVLITYVAVAGIFRSAAKHFWPDELLTLTVAQQPTTAGIWEALSRGAVNSDPPSFPIVERLAGAVVPNEHIAYRIPSVIALCCVVLCVFVFVRRRSGGIYGLICAVVPLVSVLYNIWVMQARGYALATACVAVALVCYQKADAIGWAVLMGASLLAASASHYLAIFALVPFALAEAAFAWKMRRLRWAAWLGLACGVVPLLVLWPVLSDYRHYYGSHFWRGTEPTLANIANVYGSFFNLLYPLGFAIAAVAALGVLETWLPVSSGKDDLLRTIKEDEFFHEKVLVLGLLALPFVFCLAMKIVRGGLVAHYLLETVLGFSLALGFILPRLQRRSVVLFATWLGFAFLLQEASFWGIHRHNLGKIDSPAHPAVEIVKAAGRQDLPVVVSDGGQYLQFVHYLDRETVNRYVAVVDPPASLTYAGSDFMDKTLVALRPYAAVHVYQFQDFSAKHHQFLLYSSGSEIWDWWPARLLNENYALTLVAFKGTERLYLVTRPGETN